MNKNNLVHFGNNDGEEEQATADYRKLYQLDVQFIGLAEKSFKGTYVVPGASIPDAIKNATTHLEKIAGEDFHFVVAGVKETKLQYIYA